MRVTHDKSNNRLLLPTRITRVVRIVRGPVTKSKQATVFQNANKTFIRNTNIALTARQALGNANRSTNEIEITRRTTKDHARKKESWKKNDLQLGRRSVAGWAELAWRRQRTDGARAERCGGEARLGRRRVPTTSRHEVCTVNGTAELDVAQDVAGQGREVAAAVVAATAAVTAAYALKAKKPGLLLITHSLTLPVLHLASVCVFW